MKLLYFGTDFEAAINSFPSTDLIKWEPPDIEAPIWELNFKDNISIYSDGRVVVVIEGEEEVEVQDLGAGKITRMKRQGKSVDKVLENKE